ncbi:TPA: hypothetical protein N0F65_010455 [Lagenidium giganteum]|uniref:RWP-RK domain-containing protein n=1 Tax=Lagenidium giganteum TaxID=4803 RepID=A0AAV2YKF2_9STRA|nr:TPA: hypothetical protein N0F65_010455 [Lagenidium giganteum]
MLSAIQAPHPLCVSSLPAMTAAPASPAPAATVQHHRTSSSTTTTSTPRAVLAQTYATYVVRVHTRHGIKTLSFDVLANFFTSTAKKAAEDLGISSRTLIRVCRSLGIRRWPYLGFRSEKNVERIRQEAIDNLRRKLERDGPGAATTLLNSDDACVRGASAKRLLQVQPPQSVGPPAPPAVTASGPAPARPAPVLSTMLHRPWPMHASHSEPQHPAVPTCEVPVVAGSHQQAMMPLMTPPPTHQGFNLEMARISPRKPLETPHRASGNGSSDDAGKPMPSLHVLVDASILAAFKHEVESHMQRERSLKMSMRDILSTTATTAA